MGIILEGETALSFLDKYVTDVELHFFKETNAAAQADIQTHPSGDIAISNGLNAIINEIRARLLTRREVIIDGKTYAGETSDPNFGSALFFMLGKKKTNTNIKTMMIYILEALLTMPYIDISSIDAELYPSDNVSEETVKITIKLKIYVDLEDISIQGDVVQMDVIY